MTRWGIVTGLKSEARLAENAARAAGVHGKLLVRCDGPGPAQARIATRALAAQGATGFLSLGLAGGLVSGLVPGSLLLPAEIVEGGGVRFAADAAAHARAASALVAETPRTDPLFGAEQVVATPEEKSELARRFAVAAVDMESGGVAEVARELGLPFLALRAVADPAERVIPGPAQAGMSEDGSVNAFAVLAQLAVEPQSVAAVLQLARDTAEGNASLGRAVRLLLPALVR